MCGINGIIKKNTSKEIILQDLETMNNRIIHRGPDDDGFFVETFENTTIGMAMRRLSIIDLTTGKQPIYSNDKQKVIVFNGEIYNYKSLREQLIQKGYTFETKSDTEVIINLYDCYGTDCFAMLDGVFGLSIFDKTLNKVFIARDYFGEKPIYYYPNDSEIIWASELKSIVNILDFKPEIDFEALNIYFQLTYIPSPFTIYKGIKKLEANHYLEVTLGAININSIKVDQKFKKYSKTSKAESIQTVHDMVQESVASRAISDVPLGTFLSGGVDSSIVSLCLAQQSSYKIDTFSIGFDKKSFDETDKSQTVAKLINSNHHEFIINEKDLEKNLNEILLNFDEPFADSSALASFVVAQKTKQYVTVALTGDGGDEVFGGYNKYYIGRLNQKYTSIIPKFIHQQLEQISDRVFKSSNDKRGKRFKLNRLIHAINYDGDFYYNIISLGFQEKEIKALLNQSLYFQNNLAYYKNKIGNQNQTLNDFRKIDQLLSLEGDMVVKVDRTSMLASLECRAPLLNKEIWNYTSQLPESFLMNGWNKKHIFKEAFKAYFPKGFLDKSKKGFGVPVGDWLRSDLKLELLKYIEKDFIRKQAIFNYEEISKIVENHISGKIDNTFRVWTYFCFQKWYANIYKT
ncbi:MAG TPA: asparagine synthase (glutamine-hydrolyzing) [Edaphocola sp.]|nr:asparagine synthase (glutamine-hydrolyzing) [Edaphocola sp.]